MKPFSFARAAFLCAGILVAIASLGCEKAKTSFLFPNQRPTVELTAAPVSSADTAWYSYKMNWSGTDGDGRVERFEYAIDPVGGDFPDTVWISTLKNEQQLFFSATQAYNDPRRGWRSNDFHTFVIRAVDNSGAVSAPKARHFYSYTIAPVVFITNPAPTKLLSRLVTPAVRINWQGRDEDGVFTQKPVKYRFRLFKISDTEFPFDKAQLYPDSLRMFYAERNWAGWDSCSGDTTFHQFTQLTPDQPHLFVVIGIDEAGAYSPDFSLESNMLKFKPGFAGTLGPVFTLFNEFFFFQYQSGGLSTDPLVWINLEVPSGQPLTFNWFAAPPEGATIEWYRWRLDGDITDEAPRSSEDTDWYHWSRKNNLTTSCTVGPFPGGEEHFLYVEAQDNNGLLSLAIVHFKTITPTFGKDLLIVDDTRLAPDQFVPPSPIPRTYGTNVWPAAAELDTFLYAKGGFPWRGPQGVTGSLPPSRPGIFNGYSFDTLGTRLGYELASAGVPLNRLGQYRHVIWLTDITGAITTQGPEAFIDPISTLRWMSGRGRSNTLATYIYAGGKVWLGGGTGLTSTLLPYNATGSRNNDAIYGPGHTVFNFSAGEIAPGRMAWDAAHWQSEFVASKPVTSPRRSDYAVGGWSNPGWKFIGTINAPDYSRLPVTMRRRALALGDTLPPTRTNSASYYSTALNPAVEYLTQPNFILEDVNQSPLVEDQRSVLDTLMELQGGALATNFTGQRPVTMTYYHGVTAPEFVLTGFDFWTWSRGDVQSLVDFVLQEIWHMNKTIPPVAPARQAALTSRPVPVPGTGSLPQSGSRSGSR